MPELRKLALVVLVTALIAAACIAYTIMFVCGDERPTPDYDTVIVPVECEGIAEVVLPIEPSEGVARNEADVQVGNFVDAPDTYLAYTGVSYDHLMDSGRHIDRYGDTQYPASQAYKDAAVIAYYALCWDTFIAYYAPGSPWVGRGVEVVSRCEAAGIRWEMAAATLYAEADWGRQTTGLVWGNASTLDGWIAWCLREMADPNDVDCFVNEFHLPTNREIYRRNFGAVVERARAWRP